MSDTWIGDVQMHDLAVDEATGEFVLVVNGVCTLAHDTVESFRAAHTGDGPCVFKPSEGLVFVMDGPQVVSWSIKDVSARTLRPATIRERAGLMPQYDAQCERIRKGLPRKKRS